jgi:hypothetical protein
MAERMMDEIQADVGADLMGIRVLHRFDCCIGIAHLARTLLQPHFFSQVSKD